METSQYPVLEYVDMPKELAGASKRIIDELDINIFVEKTSKMFDGLP